MRRPMMSRHAISGYRDIGILAAETIGQGVRGFPDNLEETLDRQLADAILVPRVPPVLHDVQDLVGSVEDVPHPLLVAAAHRSMDSLRMCWSRSFSPPVDTTSTGWPRSSSSSLVIRIRSKRELPWLKSTRKSMSLSGRSSPRATEPNRRTRRSEEHTSELQSLRHLVCRLLLE